MTPDQARAQISRLKRRWEKNTDKRKNAKKLLNMAEGSWRGAIPKMPAEPDWHAESHTPFAPNLLGLALKQLSHLYDEEPIRTCDLEAEQTWAEAKLWQWGLGLSVAMERADRMVRLLGTCLLYPIWRPSPDSVRDLRAALLRVTSGNEPEANNSVEEDGVEVLVVTRNQFEALPNELDPRHIEAAIVWMGCDEVELEGGLKKTVDVHHYWDREFFAVLRDFVPVVLAEDGSDIIPHGMPDHPFVIARNDESGHGLEAAGWGGDDLYANLLAVGSLLREYGRTGKLQRGQPVVVGQVTNPVLAPDAILQIDAGGSFEIVANAANLDGMRDCCTTHLELLSRCLGLPSRTWRLDDGNSASGIAIALDRADLEDDRRARIKLTRAWERAVHRKAAVAYNAARGTAWSGIVRVSYRPIPQIVSFDERLKRLEFLRAQGLIGDIDTLRELYPDASEGDLEERLARAREDAALASPVVPAVGGTVGGGA